MFDACDYNGDGFVKVQDLIELGKQHSVGNSGDVSTLFFLFDLMESPYPSFFRELSINLWFEINM